MELDQMIEELRQAHEKTRARLDEQVAVVTAIAAELERYANMLQAAGYKPPGKKNGGAPPRKAASKAAPTKSQPPVSSETIEAVYDAIVAWLKKNPHLSQQVPGAFTRHVARDVSSLHDSTVSRAMVALRDAGRIRMVGRERLNGSPRVSDLYVIDGN